MDRFVRQYLPFNSKETDTNTNDTGADSDTGSDEDIISFTDDDEQQEGQPPLKEMVCYRCPNKKTGTFKNEAKFRMHVARHAFGEHFSCQARTCGRPFTKFSYCLSHEIRVHGLKMEYETRDPVIVLAKNYLKKKEERRAAGEDLEGNETDEEDPKFYENQVFPSTSLTPYRGPPVTHPVQCYAIHLKYIVPRKKGDWKADKKICETAISQHIENVKSNRAEWALGDYFGEFPGSTAADSKSDNSNDLEKVKGSNKELVLPSTSSETGGNGSHVPAVSVEVNKTQRGRKKPPPTNSYPQIFPATWTGATRKCRKCDCPWTTQQDLVTHRNNAHPGISLAELMTEQNPTYIPQPDTTANKMPGVQDNLDPRCSEFILQLPKLTIPEIEKLTGKKWPCQNVP